jgi:hypothetical protein
VSVPLAVHFPAAGEHEVRLTSPLAFRDSLKGTATPGFTITVFWLVSVESFEPDVEEHPSRIKANADTRTDGRSAMDQRRDVAGVSR